MVLPKRKENNRKNKNWADFSFGPGEKLKDVYKIGREEIKENSPRKGKIGVIQQVTNLISNAILFLDTDEKEVKKNTIAISKILMKEKCSFLCTIADSIGEALEIVSDKIEDASKKEIRRIFLETETGLSSTLKKVESLATDVYNVSLLASGADGDICNQEIGLIRSFLEEYGLDKNIDEDLKKYGLEKNDNEIYVGTINKEKYLTEKEKIFNRIKQVHINDSQFKEELLSRAVRIVSADKKITSQECQFLLELAEALELDFGEEAQVRIGSSALVQAINAYKEELETTNQQNEEIKAQNEEILAQRDVLAENNVELEKKNEEIERQKAELEKINKKITDSINYAKRIQDAVLDPEEFKSIFPDSFVLHKPKDIVSGDFYWTLERKTDGSRIIVAADCTGHGVPGAFMSMLGIAFLNEINTDQSLTADAILNKLRSHVKRTLKQSGKSGEAQDGMDIALCIISPDGKKISFAGAYNPLYIVKNKEILEMKADRMPIGIHPKAEVPFTNNAEIEVDPGDSFYIFSDGYSSQFGGGKGEKMKAYRLKEAILEVAHLSFDEQEIELNRIFEEWRKENEQTDDVILIGFTTKPSEKLVAA